jgi:hypothetical protein
MIDEIDCGLDPFVEFPKVDDEALFVEDRIRTLRPDLDLNAIVVAVLTLALVTVGNIGQKMPCLEPILSLDRKHPLFSFRWV